MNPGRCKGNCPLSGIGLKILMSSTKVGINGSILLRLYFVSNVGHANPRVLDAIRRTLDKPLLHCYAYTHELRLEYLRELIPDLLTDSLKKHFYFLPGTEATKAGMKLARMYGQKNASEDRALFVLKATGMEAGLWAPN